jgi:hypothetical protein
VEIGGINVELSGFCPEVGASCGIIVEFEFDVVGAISDNGARRVKETGLEVERSDLGRDRRRE